MPDDSTQHVLREVAVLTHGRKVNVRHPHASSSLVTHKSQIHTISFNCETTNAVDFLRALAGAHNGRFHFFERMPKTDDSPFYYDFATGSRILSRKHDKAS